MFTSEDNAFTASYFANRYSYTPGIFCKFALFINEMSFKRAPAMSYW